MKVYLDLGKSTTNQRSGKNNHVPNKQVLLGTSEVFLTRLLPSDLHVLTCNYVRWLTKFSLEG